MNNTKQEIKLRFPSGMYIRTVNSNMKNYLISYRYHKNQKSRIDTKIKTIVPPNATNSTVPWNHHKYHRAWEF